MKKKLPEWWPKNHINPLWYDTGIFTEQIINNSKLALGKIGLSNFEPKPQDIFRQFYVNPDNLKFILVNNVYPLCVHRDDSGFPLYKDYPYILKEIWQNLSDEYKWDKVEEYTYPDLSDWRDTLVLSLNLTTNSKGVWDNLMDNLFDWFESNGNRYVFCFMDDESFKRADKLKKNHDIFYKFHPKDIAETIEKQHGGTWFWGLPF